MNINYTLSGSIEVPDGSTLTDTGTGITLPDGRVLKLWEGWEIHSTNLEEEPTDVSFDELSALGCHYDGDMARFEEAWF